MHQQDRSISWHAPEFRYYEKSGGWYVTLISIAILVIGFFILEKDIFAAISIGIITSFIIFFSRHYPETIKIELDHKGIKLGTIHYPYKQLKYFWVVHNENHKSLNLETTTFINQLIVVELNEQNPDEVRNFLLDFLPEHEETEETFTQKVMHKLKF